MRPQIGASLSIKQCRQFRLRPLQVMSWAVKQLGIRRFRLMSYWDEHEPKPGTYDFAALDRQIKLAQKLDVRVSLCLGVRQPRWPENHWPEWAWQLPKADQDRALLAYVEQVVRRYRSYDCIVSWQLENEALLTSFGERSGFDRKRLRDEFALIKSLDDRPVIMTTSTSWGIPLRRPIPDIVGFSYYNVVFNKGRYRRSIFQPWIFKLRAGLIKLMWRRPSFIHELQAEPWGPKNIWEMPIIEQNKSMSSRQLEQNLRLASSTKLFPIDLWGLEWWYWRSQQGDRALVATVRSFVRPKQQSYRERPHSE